MDTQYRRCAILNIFGPTRLQSILRPLFGDMFAQHTPDLKGTASSAGPALSPSAPVVFDTFAGIYQHPVARVRAAVLMLSPLGYEELCSRAFWAKLADRLAEAGIASLRFDYPGTANALDGIVEGLGDWRRAAQQAAEALRISSGLQDIVVLGQGLGGTLACTWSSDLGPIRGLALLEPSASGRSYLRGLTGWGRAIAQSSGPGPDSQSRYSVAGFSLPQARAAAIQDLDIGTNAPRPCHPTLLLERAGGPVGRLFDKTTWAAGAAISRQSFAEYDGLLTDPTAAAIPTAAIAAITTWICGLGGKPGSGETPGKESPTWIVGDHFEEQPIRFGPDNRLAGVVCRPRSPAPSRSAVVIAGAGRDHSIGWGRSSVEQARLLAKRGVATLRFDAGGIGDSRPSADAPDEILYSRQLCDELRMAVDVLDGFGYMHIGLSGRCSGAWASFTLATEDPRIRSLAIVNLPYFIWDSSCSLNDVIRFSQRRMSDLGATLMSRRGFERLFRGDLDIRGAFRFLIRQTDLRLLRPAAPYLGQLTRESRRFHELHRRFEMLQARNVPLFLGYAVGDASLGELRSFMGNDLARLKRYRNVSFREFADADHNFTPEPARSALLDALAGFFATQEHREFSPTLVSAAVHAANKERSSSRALPQLL